MIQLSLFRLKMACFYDFTQKKGYDAGWAPHVPLQFNPFERVLLMVRKRRIALFVTYRQERKWIQSRLMVAETLQK
ncbi:MAG: hypothetical protein H7839_13035 [Magnetococcus sp. YQC-5]